ncbi:hypothetical protein F5882DRAFT_383932 [Hyaloscypha sp. PMI_1271]|uniref:Uncharacterized protein n=1 Tax=Hyaloscypha finlandica TaxID=2482753 RepID=C3VES7_9HELO|nr:secreted hypothetical protein [Hyaloscypha finlandica]KAH8762225.1 hypothetical protein F5882DRAFT_383932 [Hyaloscypha sp. PMI_1271]
MQFPITAILTLLPLLAMASPAPAPPEATAANTVEERSLEKRSATGTVQVNGLRHRSCPRTSCTANGEYFKGDKIKLSCFTRKDTTVVKGDAGWAKVASNGDWVAMAFGEYITWDATLHTC